MEMYELIKIVIDMCLYFFVCIELLMLDEYDFVFVSF